MGRKYYCDCVKGKDAVIYRPPAYSFGKRLRQANGEEVPGPGTYQDIPSAFGFTKPHSRAANMASGRTHRLYNLSPGPSEYNPRIDVTRAGVCAFTLGGKPTQAHLKAATPGPGAYSLRGSPQHQAYSFGVRLEGSAAKQHTPGPADYAPQPRRGGAAVTLKFRHPSGRQEALTPGPGEYRSSLSTHPRAPAYRIGQRWGGSTRADELPGPGHYDHECLCDTSDDEE